MKIDHPIRAWLGAAFALGLFAAPAAAQTAASAEDLSELKQLSIDDLMNTQVTSVSRYPEKIQDAAASIQVVDSEEMNRFGSTTIADALRLADNLEVDQKDPHDWGISARGFNANVGDKLLVLMDGRSVYTPLFSGVFWNAQDYLLEDLDRIEVISGPGGALWGANAVNGVINITSKSAQETQGTYASAGLGSDSQQYLGARYGGQLAPDVYFRVYGKFLAQGDSTLADGARGSDSWSQTQAGFRIDSIVSPRNPLTLQGDAYGDVLNLQGSGAARMGGGNLLGRWSHTGANGSQSSVEAYWDRDDLADPFGPTPYSAEGDLIDRLDTYDIQFQNHFQLAEHHALIWGAEYRHIDDDTLQESPSFAFLPADEDQSLGSAFVQDDAELLPDWHLIAGTKVEDDYYTGVEWSPNLRLRHDFTASQMIWAAVSRAVRTPSRFDRDLYEPDPPPAIIAGNSTFRSEVLVAYELGYRARLGRQTLVSLSLFYNDYTDLRSLNITPVTLFPVYYANGLAAHSGGAEFSLDHQILPGWQAHIGYDYLREHVWVQPGQFDLQGGTAETEDPEFQFFLRSTIDLPANLSFNPAFRWIGALAADTDGPVIVPAYADLDAALTWGLTRHVEISVVGDNLLHRAHAEYGAASPTLEKIPRTVYVKTEVRF